MTQVTLGSGELTLPRDVQARYQLTPETPIRLIETRNGILLIPLTDAPMTEELAQELQEWQALGQDVWASFPYEEDAA